MSIKGNTIGTTSPRADWAEQDPTKASFIRNKPELDEVISQIEKENIFAPTGYGLGGETGGRCADCNTTIRNGWYNINGETANPPTINGVTHNIATLFVVARASRIWQTAYSNTSSVHAILQRTSWNSGTSWNEWEWVNPPMSVGVEYRTTERYQGVAVYKKVDADGNILWRKNGDTKWRLMSAASYVANATVE